MRHVLSQQRCRAPHLVITRTVESCCTCSCVVATRLCEAENPGCCGPCSCAVAAAAAAAAALVTMPAPCRRAVSAAAPAAQGPLQGWHAGWLHQGVSGTHARVCLALCGLRPAECTCGRHRLCHWKAGRHRYLRRGRCAEPWRRHSKGVPAHVRGSRPGWCAHASVAVQWLHPVGLARNAAARWHACRSQILCVAEPALSQPHEQRQQAAGCACLRSRLARGCGWLSWVCACRLT